MSQEKTNKHKPSTSLTKEDFYYRLTFFSSGIVFLCLGLEELAVNDYLSGLITGIAMAFAGFSIFCSAKTIKNAKDSGSKK